jgi:7-cyano-7-deazaguanine synthase in queuosine biosynthesis
MKIVILYSGGLDSFILKKYAEFYYPFAEIKCIYYKHGADSEEEEIKQLPSFVEVRTIDWLNKEIRPVAKKDDPFAGSIYIPGRNLVFTILAASQELPDKIWMGTVIDEDNIHATDKNEHFRDSTSQLLQYVLSPFKDSIEIDFPFVRNNLTKEGCVRWALSYNVTTTEELKKTVSCWHHKGNKPCGRCKQCFKRWFVFFLNGFSEEYDKDPVFSEYGKEMIAQYFKKVYHDKNANADEINVVRMISSAVLTEDFPLPLRGFVLNEIRKYV